MWTSRYPVVQILAFGWLTVLIVALAGKVLAKLILEALRSATIGCLYAVSGRRPCHVAISSSTVLGRQLRLDLTLVRLRCAILLVSSCRRVYIA